MPVNDLQLRNYLMSINIEIKNHEQAAKDLNNARTAFDKIQLVDGVAKTDPDTGVVFTQARRDEIYDACEPTVRRLLGLDETTE